MNRRAALARKTGLRTYTPLRRVAGLGYRRVEHTATGLAVARTTRDEWETLRELAWLRCDGWCEMCGAKLNPAWWEWSHRLFKSHGGPDDIRNGCALHPLSCHREGPRSVHKAPDAAWRTGFIVKSGEDFRRRPVLIGGESWARLTFDGSYDWVNSGDAA
jgi:hypothetical protein